MFQLHDGAADTAFPLSVDRMLECSTQACLFYGRNVCVAIDGATTPEEPGLTGRTSYLPIPVSAMK